MCKFMSCVSDGAGEVKFFTAEDIIKEMSIGNPRTYDWNSHTSICQFHGISSKDEDKWNKWEYNPETKELVVDSLVTTDDRKSVLFYMDKYFSNKDILFLRNLYGNNSGNCNRGNCNSGDMNSGDGNSGNRNSGDRNSGNRNSGDRNSGDMNSGDWNSGNGNSGNRNSGDRNIGNRNSGDRNRGNCNSGDMNSGDGNSGNCNSGDGVLNSFCTKRKYMLFDKVCTEKEYAEFSKLSWVWFNIKLWVFGGDMTEEEKNANPSWKTTGGYLKHIAYKDAWKKCPPDFIKDVKKLKNFDAKKFFEITGLEV